MPSPPGVAAQAGTECVADGVMCPHVSPAVPSASWSDPPARRTGTEADWLGGGIVEEDSRLALGIQ